ncbi:AIR carboxylase family protein, partial [Salmonella enterica]|uniref:AIR carboxylase family protein n=1 Tax=Salmonella enterica TaxID=28901 RepID=UPI003D27D8EE
LHGQDALLSTVQMPAGCPVATMAIDGAENAAVIAAQIIALTDEGVFDRLVDYKQARYMRSLKDDEEIQELVKAM